MRLKTYCWIGLGLYAALSVSDLLLTRSLLRADDEAFEANPVAAVWLEEHGWAGLAAFKAASVLVFLGAVVLLLRRHPALAAGVVTAACAVLLTVNAYSHSLLRQSEREAAAWEALASPLDDSPIAVRQARQ